MMGAEIWPGAPYAKAAREGLVANHLMEAGMRVMGAGFWPGAPYANAARGGLVAAQADSAQAARLAIGARGAPAPHLCARNEVGVA